MDHNGNIKIIYIYIFGFNVIDTKFEVNLSLIWEVMKKCTLSGLLINIFIWNHFILLECVWITYSMMYLINLQSSHQLLGSTSYNDLRPKHHKMSLSIVMSSFLGKWHNSVICYVVSCCQSWSPVDPHNCWDLSTYFHFFWK